MIPHNKPTIDEDEIKAVSDVIRSGWIAQGPKAEAFEEKFGTIFGFAGVNCITVSSGSAALFLALKALDIQNGDEVVIPTYTCSAVLNAVFLVGAKPVLVDVSIDDFNPTIRGILEKISPKTKAIIITHTFGFPFDIKELIKKTNVPIIEDCAAALGSKVQKKPVGLLGKIAIFSFYASKVITTGYGGMVCSKDNKIASKLRDWRNFDQVKEYFPRFNFQMSDISAVMGIVQLKKLNKLLKIRNKIAKEYKTVTENKGWQYQKNTNQNFKPNYYRFILKLSSQGERDRLKKHLFKKGIKTIIPIENYELLHNYLKLKKHNYPVAEKLSNITLSLPIFPDMIECGYINKTIKILKEF